MIKIGNLQSSGTRGAGWNGDNQPSYVSYLNTQGQSLRDYFTYDADGARLTRATTNLSTAQDVSHVTYVEGLMEFESDGIVGGHAIERSFYVFNGQVVAQRMKEWSGPTFTESVLYLHGDHLGSISLATNAVGGRHSNQDFDPWGKVRPGNTITQTPLNLGTPSGAGYRPTVNGACASTA